MQQVVVTLPLIATTILPVAITVLTILPVAITAITILPVAAVALSRPQNPPRLPTSPRTICVIGRTESPERSSASMWKGHMTRTTSSWTSIVSVCFVFFSLLVVSLGSCSSVLYRVRSFMCLLFPRVRR